MLIAEKLAISGGPKAKTVPYGTGKRFGIEEANAAVAAIQSQKLWYKGGGTRVISCENTICEMWGVEHAIACSSGSAAVHTALIMCGVEKDDEVIVNPISDWGSIMGIIAIGAVPVFCDISEQDFSLDPNQLSKCITEKTKAIVLVHYCGYPAQVEEIVALADEHGIKVIEDCAQAHLSMIKDKPLGTIGHVGAFSTNDSKHISCGEGGFIITNDSKMADTGRLFIDKCYGTAARGKRDVIFLGFNYRLSELSAAVLEVQLGKLPEYINQRDIYAQAVIIELQGIKGFKLLSVHEGHKPAFWCILSYIQPEAFSATRGELIDALVVEGIAVSSALAPVRTLYDVSYLQERGYPKSSYPVAEKISDQVIVLGCSQFYTQQDAEETVIGVRKVLEFYEK